MLDSYLDQYEDYRLDRAVSIAAPATRLVVLDCWAERDEVGAWSAQHQTHPVLAVEARIVSDFSRPRREGDRRRPASDAELGRGGWAHEVTGVEYDALIWTEDYGIAPAKLALEASNEAFAVVACPWPPDEDPDRLAPHLRRLEVEAIAKAERDERRRSAASPAVAPSTHHAPRPAPSHPGETSNAPPLLR